MKALILVDLQNDFAESGALPVKNGREIIPLINQLQGSFDLIVATQDWHPPNHGSFAVNHRGHKPGDRILLDGLPQILWPVHCVQGTPGADFVEGLERNRWAAICQKGIDAHIDSYSGFFDNGRRRSTGLHDFLTDYAVKEVYLAGWATDYCVKFTALDAARLGYVTRVFEDACRGVDLAPGDSTRAVDEMRHAGVEVIRAEGSLPT